MSPGSIPENVKVLAIINRKDRRIELYLVESGDIEMLDIDSYEYDIDLATELAKLAKERGNLIAIFGFDRIAEEGEE
jgi:hypothetical protein